ncbi:hypothetical protein P7D22_13215 [Lichenihabitans sp. Uapishka_5]|uniref:hypothetical protein n=1 Tax=Lichenihabitans sp. Uapishka_5 TaxID=3037302 RepID=UPI0029E7F653|nr:hypothetical protein [Lichenihabitans sp. Uapishka_5]MDX7952134.1 hypothetical protein [Lichenihabitans sp. Uapishka_5]
MTQLDPVVMDAAAHFQNSTLRERIVEHVFVGQALKALWCRGVVDVEVLRSEFDAHGYDLVMARAETVRHIQFKTGSTVKPGEVSVSTTLAAKPSGCVLWIRVTPQLDMGPYFWFGGAPGQPLPSLAEYPSPRRPTHNKAGERPLRKNHRLIPGKAFSLLPTMDAVLDELFSPQREVS